MRGFHRLALSLAALALFAPASAFATHDLIFSEYVEGSSFNKAVEIYNPTGAPVDLGAYSILLYFNGNVAVGNTIALPGVSLAPGAVFVVANSSASAPLLAAADMTSGSLNFNGDDAVVLFNGSSSADVIGQIGVDPGSEWGTGAQSTADNTIRRNASVCEGDTNPDDPYDPTVEWTGFVTDTFDGVGAHSSSCLAVPGAPGWVLGAMAVLMLAGAMIVVRRRAGQITA